MALCERQKAQYIYNVQGISNLLTDSSELVLMSNDEVSLQSQTANAIFVDSAHQLTFTGYLIK